MKTPANKDARNKMAAGKHGREEHFVRLVHHRSAPTPVPVGPTPYWAKFKRGAIKTKLACLRHAHVCCEEMNCSNV